MAYLEEVFYPATLDAAKDVALSPDAQDPGKFARETAWTVSFLASQGLVTQESRVLDFGCGMGRVARELIERVGCKVDGVDTSASMRRFATEYVQSPLFEVRTEPREAAYDTALALLVLQHVRFPDIEVERLQGALVPGGRLVLLNEERRVVPTRVDADGFVQWRDDGVSIEGLMGRYFTLEGRYAYCDTGETPLTVWRRL